MRSQKTSAMKVNPVTSWNKLFGMKSSGGKNMQRRVRLAGLLSIVVPAAVLFMVLTAVYFGVGR